jgi:hypothetical protein
VKSNILGQQFWSTLFLVFPDFLSEFKSGRIFVLTLEPKIGQSVFESLSIFLGQTVQVEVLLSTAELDPHICEQPVFDSLNVIHHIGKFCSLT